MKMPRWLTVPAGESQLSLALCVSLLMMGLMLWALLWQADVIDYQRNIIRWLWTGRWGS